MKLYCSNCGHPNPYAGKKPNFCVNCGHSFNQGQAAAQTQEVEENLEDLVEFVEDTPTNLSGLDVEIEPFGQTNSVTLGEVVNNSLDSKEGLQPAPKAKRAKAKRITKKAREENAKNVMEEFRKEAGASRRDKPDS
jgi:hypothetical protein